MLLGDHLREGSSCSTENLNSITNVWFICYVDNDLLTFIRIDRKGKLLGSLVKYLRVDLNSELSIVFEGEKGADVGGLTR